jgi:hypothetical protein
MVRCSSRMANSKSESASSRRGARPSKQYGDGSAQSVHSRAMLKLPRSSSRRRRVSIPAIRRAFKTWKRWPRSGWKGWRISAHPKCELRSGAVRADRRNAQRPLLPIRLWYVDAPYRFRRVGFSAQRFLDLIQKPLHTGFRRFDLFDLHAVHPRRALVGSHPLPCRFQHIAPVDPVIQHIKPKLRLLLGLLTQLLSQQREFIWQSVSTRLFIQGFDMQPFFRNGNLFQAALLSSYSSNASSKAPSLHGRYPLLHYYGPLRLPARADSSVMYSLGPSGFRLHSPALPGLPGSSTDLFLRAVPNHPGRSDRCLLIASPPMSGFIILGRLATFALASRGRIGFACATARRFASPVSTRRITPPRSGSATCTNEQFTW